MTTTRAPSVGFVLEQSLGHVTHSANLHRLVPRHPEILARFADLPFQPSGPRARLPVYRSNWTVRAGVLARRAIADMHRSGPLDGLFIHTQVPAVLAASWVRKLPTVISLDATPLQYDSLGSHYGHASGGRRLEQLKWNANRRAFRQARHIVAWSDWTKHGLVDEYDVDESKITVIPPGVDPAQWGRSSPRPAGDGPVRILFVGADLVRKGGDTLLSAAAAVAARPSSRPIELHLVTKSDVAPTPGVVVHKNLMPNSAELIALYHSCDVFALPTRGDCLPMVLSEAGAAELPLVSTDVGAISEIVRDGETGLLVPVDDDVALGAALARLVDDDSLRTSMGSKAAALVNQRFDAAANVESLVHLLTRTVEGGSLS